MLKSQLIEEPSNPVGLGRRKSGDLTNEKAAGKAFVWAGLLNG